MGWWQVNADTLAGSRFVLSPLAETFAGLKMLFGHDPKEDYKDKVAEVKL